MPLQPATYNLHPSLAQIYARSENRVIGAYGRIPWRLPDDFAGTTLVGTAIDLDVLESAGVARADVLVAATYGDNSNLTAVQLARLKYDVPRVIARVKDPVRAQVFADRGIETICSTDIIAGAIMDRLAGSPAA